MFKKLIVVMIVMAISASAIAAKGGKKEITGVVNINTATASELMMIPGVGKSKAQAILELRKAGPFKSVSDLAKVKGIGSKRAAKLLPFVTLEGPTTAKLIKPPKTAQN